MVVRVDFILGILSMGVEPAQYGSKVNVNNL
jgi:hypothetical protein